MAPSSFSAYAVFLRAKVACGANVPTRFRVVVVVGLALCFVLCRFALFFSLLGLGVRFILVFRVEGWQGWLFFCYHVCSLWLPAASSVCSPFTLTRGLFVFLSPSLMSPSLPHSISPRTICLLFPNYSVFLTRPFSLPCAQSKTYCSTKQ